jgi:hypothetical protein
LTASPDELERLGLRSRAATPGQHSQNRIEHGVQVLADVLGKKMQHEVAVFLQQLILSPIATIRDGIREVLSAVEFDSYTRGGAQKIDFKVPKPSNGIGSAALRRNRPLVSFSVSGLR